MSSNEGNSRKHNYEEIITKILEKNKQENSDHNGGEIKENRNKVLLHSANKNHNTKFDYGALLNELKNNNREVIRNIKNNDNRISCFSPNSKMIDNYDKFINYEGKVANNHSSNPSQNIEALLKKSLSKKIIEKQNNKQKTSNSNQSSVNTTNQNLTTNCYTRTNHSHNSNNTNTNQVKSINTDGMIKYPTKKEIKVCGNLFSPSNKNIHHTKSKNNLNVNSILKSSLESNGTKLILKKKEMKIEFEENFEMQKNKENKLINNNYNYNNQFDIPSVLTKSTLLEANLKNEKIVSKFIKNEKLKIPTENKSNPNSPNKPKTNEKKLKSNLNLFKKSNLQIESQISPNKINNRSLNEKQIKEKSLSRETSKVLSNKINKVDKYDSNKKENKTVSKIENKNQNEFNISPEGKKKSSRNLINPKTIISKVDLNNIDNNLHNKDNKTTNINSKNTQNVEHINLMLYSDNNHNNNIASNTTINIRNEFTKSQNEKKLFNLDRSLSEKNMNINKLSQNLKKKSLLNNPFVPTVRTNLYEESNEGSINLKSGDSFFDTPTVTFDRQLSINLDNQNEIYSCTNRRGSQLDLLKFKRLELAREKKNNFKQNSEIEVQSYQLDNVINLDKINEKLNSIRSNLDIIKNRNKSHTQLNTEEDEVLLTKNSTFANGKLYNLTQYNEPGEINLTELNKK